MQHIIKKQVIEVKLTDRSSAFEVQQGLSDFYWKKIIPELEKIFDQVSGEREIIHIDQLEIDLGELRAEQLNFLSLTEIVPGIISKAKEAIKTQSLKSITHSAVNITSQWLYYMEKGRLNWNTFKADASWNEQVLEAFATDFISIASLRKTVRENKYVLHRIAALHDDLFLTRLTEALTAVKQNVLLEFIRDLDKVLLHAGTGSGAISDADKTIIKRKAWQTIIEEAATNPNAPATERLITKALQWLIKEGTGVAWLQLASASHAKTVADYVRQLTGTANKNQPEKQAAGDEIDLKNNLQRGRQESNTAQDLSQKINNNRYEAAKENKKTKAEKVVGESLEKIIEEEKMILKKKEGADNGKAAAEEGIFTGHAGLVLLHPFFNSLFNRLSLVQDGKFKDSSSQLKAIYILYYLATGKEEPQEFELLMPKFLSGYPVEDIIPFPVLLEPSEKEEVNNLLEAAIEKWKVLGNTSPSALRESFLQRRGKLFSRNETLYLQVEAGPFDMLIDHLPWNLSIIKLPWMKEMLRVEWR